MYKISINCASGVENVLKRELIALGYGERKADNGSFLIEGNDEDVATCNMFLHTAEHVFLFLAGFDATDFDCLFDGVYDIDWHAYLPADARIVVNAKSVKSGLFALSAIQSVAKKAIIKKLSDKTHNTVFPETGDRYGIEVNIFNDHVSVLMDTGGKGLHKRGYRDYVSAAPMKETLACACLLLSDFSADRPFRDPFCGSGTIVTEAARMALNIAPGTDRDFDFLHWRNFDPTAYARVRERALDLQKKDRKIDFVGSDIDPEAIKLCNRHAQRAGLSGKIRFELKDVADFLPDGQGGTIVTNPPYGERLLDLQSARKVVATFGRNYKKLFDWSAFVISSDSQFERNFGKQAAKKRKLYNANKECNLYQYFRSSNEKRHYCKMADVFGITPDEKD